MLKKDKLFNALFMTGSIVALFLFVFLYLIFSLVLSVPSSSRSTQVVTDREDRYFLKNQYREDDPFITRNPNLKDMLAGPIISSQDPGMGDKEAPVVMVQFSDFECDFCAKQEIILKEVKEEFGEKLRIIWKDYPERDYNSQSFQASWAARCAMEQDKFWEFHDYLFENNSSLSEEVLYNGAQKLGLDSDIFEDCMENSEIRKRINENIAEANALDISGVPFLYVNDQEIMGGVTKEDLEKIIKIELEKK